MAREKGWGGGGEGMGRDDKGEGMTRERGWA